MLKWVGAEREAEIRTLFAQTLVVRGLGADARLVADRLFLETLVRLHREGEGAPYTGLKPGGTPIEPAVAAADRALESGSADALVRTVTGEVERGIRERHERALEARAHAGESVHRGREAVAAYVAFVHYVERLHSDASTTPTHHAHETAAATSPDQR